MEWKMKYLLMMYADEKAGEALAGDRPIPERMSALMSGKKPRVDQPRDEMDAWMEKIMAYRQDLRKAGVLVDSEALLPTSASSTVRVRSGKTLITHGPFAETKEQLGGYYILECRNLDDALEWAAKAPQAAFGTVEVRPIRAMENGGRG
jgi:hypothetical protein